MADALTLVPRVMPGVAVQVIDDDVLVLAGGDLTRLTGALARTMREVDGIRRVRSEEVDALVSRGILELVDGGPEPRYRRPDHVGMSQDPDALVLLDLTTGARPASSVPTPKFVSLRGTLVCGFRNQMSATGRMQ